MKEYQAADIRNFAIVGHASAGKTMLSEAMLETAGVINRMGSIAAGSTVSDYHDSEQQRQISVSATLMHAARSSTSSIVLDTPISSVRAWARSGLAILLSWSSTPITVSVSAPTPPGNTRPRTAFPR
jgi:hypothetical protein